MPTPAPIYTSTNIKFAYQLRWGLTIFWRKTIDESQWLEAIRDPLEQDGIRILSWKWLDDDGTQFALSTKPIVAPSVLVQRLKGRLQHVVSDIVPKVLKHHYALRSFGSQSRDVIESYIATQTAHHPMASAQSDQIFHELAFRAEDVDLGEARFTTHSRYWYNLHLVLVNSHRWCDVHRLRSLLNR